MGAQLGEIKTSLLPRELAGLGQLHCRPSSSITKQQRNQSNEFQSFYLQLQHEGPFLIIIDYVRSFMLKTSIFIFDGDFIW